jgi:hypothetical protein
MRVASVEKHDHDRLAPARLLNSECDKSDDAEQSSYRSDDNLPRVPETHLPAFVRRRGRCMIAYSHRVPLFDL